MVPTFDRRDMVRRALTSLRAQTRRPEQIVLVDDGSTDGTAAAVREEFPEVDVVEQPRGGVSAARNRGIREASGRWIGLLDSDDEWKPTKLERQLEALAGTRFRVCHCDEIWIRDGVRVNPRRRHAKRGGRIYLDCLPLCSISPSAVLIDRGVFEKVGTFDEDLPVCEDYDLWLRIAARYPVLLVEERLVIKHGGHEDQLSRSRWGMDRFRIPALARAWRTLDLGGEERIATLETLVAKLGILIEGARKRGRIDLLHQLEPQLGHYRLILELERGGDRARADTAPTPARTAGRLVSRATSNPAAHGAG